MKTFFRAWGSFCAISAKVRSFEKSHCTKSIELLCLASVTILIIGDNTDSCQQGIWSDLILEITPS